MPKKWHNNQNIGRNNYTNPDYFCHDDRGVQANKQNRRVIFKTPAHGRHGRHSKVALQMGIKHRLDDDVSMAETSNSTRGRRSPPGNLARKGILNRKKPARAVASWYLVTIPYGQKYNKEFILTSIKDLIKPKTIVPLMYHVIQKDVHFYLDNEEDASMVRECTHRIVTNDGYKLRIIVKPGYHMLEAGDINDAFKNKIKLALSKRFFEATNALDLSSFHRDPELAPDYFCALFRPPVMHAVLTIIAEHIPNVMALNFNDNKLTDITHLRTLKDKFKNLKILYLGDNKLKEINQLNYIKDLQLQELVLQGNPLCNRYKSRQTDYIW